MTGNRPLNIGMSPRWSWHVLDTLSWFSATQADPAMQDPLLVYARLFGSAAERADRARFQRMLALRRSVLDGIVDQQASLDQRLGHADRHHLDAYFTNLRETELRLSEDRTLVCTEPPEADYGDRNKETWAHLNVDLTLLAFDCQATNVVTISTWGAGGGVGGPVTGEYIPGLNNPIEDYHHFSHFADGFGVRPEFDDFVTVTDWSVGHLTRIVEGLAARTDPDGESMLHNSLVMYGSGIGDAAGHEYSNVARIFLGRLGGLVNPGRVITPSGAQSPAENLLPEILDLFGYRKPDGSPQSVVGLSNGVISLR